MFTLYTIETWIPIELDIVWAISLYDLLQSETDMTYKQHRLEHVLRAGSRRVNWRVHVKCNYSFVWNGFYVDYVIINNAVKNFGTRLLKNRLVTSSFFNIEVVWMS